MTWKPTDEMVEAFRVACRDHERNSIAALTAVQPLIAAQATAPLKAELEASMAEIAQLRADLAEMKMDANADVIRPHIAAEARAKALEEAAKFAYDFHTGSGYQIAEYLRSLIPKPPEGT